MISDKDSDKLVHQASMSTNNIKSDIDSFKTEFKFLLETKILDLKKEF